MAYYKVGADGKAPTGLSVGDYVVTGGGTYKITAVNPDGTYKSSLVDQAQTTYNYSSGYATPTTTSNSSNITNAQKVAQSSSPATVNQQSQSTSVAAGTGTSVSNPGQGDLYYDAASGRITRTLNGVNYYVDPQDEKYASIYAEAVSRGVVKPAQQVQTESQVEIPTYQEPDTSAQMAQLQTLIDQIANTQYTPVNVQEQMANTMTYEDAYKLAQGIISPQYENTYQKTADQSAQNLDRAGLYNSLYGQALSADAQRDVTSDMNSAIGTLALDIQNNDWAKAAQTLQMLISEQQYGASYTQNALSTAAQASISYIDSIVQQAAASNNYTLQAASLQLQQEAQNLEALYTQGSLTQMELENQLAQLEIQAAQQALTADKTKPTPDNEPDDTYKGSLESSLDPMLSSWYKQGKTADEILAFLQKLITSGSYTEAEASAAWDRSPYAS